MDRNRLEPGFAYQPPNSIRGRRRCRHPVRTSTGLRQAATKSTEWIRCLPQKAALKRTIMLTQPAWAGFGLTNTELDSVVS